MSRKEADSGGVPAHPCPHAPLALTESPFRRGGTSRERELAGGRAREGTGVQQWAGSGREVLRGLSSRVSRSSGLGRGERSWTDQKAGLSHSVPGVVSPSSIWGGMLTLPEDVGTVLGSLAL